VSAACAAAPQRYDVPTPRRWVSSKSASPAAGALAREEELEPARAGDPRAHRDDEERRFAPAEDVPPAREPHPRRQHDGLREAEGPLGLRLHRAEGVRPRGEPPGRVVPLGREPEPRRERLAEADAPLPLHALHGPLLETGREPGGRPEMACAEAPVEGGVAAEERQLLRGAEPPVERGPGLEQRRGPEEVEREVVRGLRALLEVERRERGDAAEPREPARRRAAERATGVETEAELSLNGGRGAELVAGDERAEVLALEREELTPKLVELLDPVAVEVLPHILAELRPHAEIDLLEDRRALGRSDVQRG
jgi:hypothetical protein